MMATGYAPAFMAMAPSIPLAVGGLLPQQASGIDPRIAHQRMHQVQHGLMSPEYQAFLRFTPLSHRTALSPPDPNANVSDAAFYDMVRRWRQSLQSWYHQSLSSGQVPATSLHPPMQAPMPVVPVSFPPMSYPMSAPFTIHHGNTVHAPHMVPPAAPASSAPKIHQPVSVPLPAPVWHADGAPPSSMGGELTAPSLQPPDRQSQSPPPSLQQRQKQIHFGLVSPEYQALMRYVPLSSSRPKALQPPNPHADTSKRTFDGMVKSWRRSLHSWYEDAVAQGLVPPPPSNQVAGSTPAAISQQEDQRVDQHGNQAQSQAEASKCTDEEELLCAICWENYQETVLLPCMHAILCAGCAKSVMSDDKKPGQLHKACPMCRSEISEVLDVAD